ncbi:MAG TPA: hypothetical protein VMZ51_08215 [Acidimicrobiales bacterium]|nr:hypothetical protein [Acidimicrobiales bacterium]
MAKPLAPTAARGQTYGAAGAQIASQRAVPMASGPPPLGSAPGPAGPPAVPPPALNAPTLRPSEPVTAGLEMGPGPGPEVLSNFEPEDPTIAELRAIYSMFPNRDLGELLEDADAGITF